MAFPLQASHPIIRRGALSAFVLVLWGFPVSAWGTQTHGGDEGIISHQIGHLVFAIGSLFVLMGLIRHNIIGPGWRSFKTFLVLLIIWNVLVFCGHWVRQVEPCGPISLFAGGRHAWNIRCAADLLYYVSALDHLLLVPAFICLWIALRRWRRSS